MQTYREENTKGEGKRETYEETERNLLSTDLLSKSLPRWDWARMKHILTKE